MKFFATDKKEWEELKKEFKDTLICKNIMAVFTSIGVFSVGACIFIVMSVLEADLYNTAEEFALPFILMLGAMILVSSLICRVAYYSFLYKFEKSKKKK